MFPQVWERVVDGSYPSQGASLQGFVRKQVRGETYPVITPGALEACVEGVLYLEISPADLARLDRFEGDFYARSSVSVTTDAGVSVTAFAYILKEEYRHILSPDEWDAEAFARQGIRRFLADYCGFER